jgi:hypothetical protein
MEHFIEIGQSVAATTIAFLLLRAIEYLVKGRQERRQRAEELRRWEERLRSWEEKICAWEEKLRGLEEGLRRWEERLRGWEERLCRVELRSLKCIIVNEELDIAARFEAYDEYKKLGGNGWIDAYASGHLTLSKDQDRGRGVGG